MHRIHIAIDNGVTGTIGIIGTEWNHFVKTPTKSEQSYTKKKQNITRIDHAKLITLLSEYIGADAIIIMERPMINPMRWKASISAARAIESTLIIIEQLGFPRMYCDSKDWQSELLPAIPKTNSKGTKIPSAERTKLLKAASVDIGCRLFPNHEHFIRKHKDADGLLIAEWARRNNL